MIYRIKNWERHFENSRTRQLDKLNWVPVPNKHDGEGFRTIMAREDGIVIYGCWHLILQVASKCQPRGTLVKEDGTTPHTAASIAVKTGAKESDIAKAMVVLMSPEVSWLESDGNEVSPECHPSVTRLQLLDSEGKGMEGNGKEENSPPPSQKVDSNPLPFLPPADDVRIEPNSVARITAAHQQYCQLTGYVIPQRPEIERAWLEYLRTHTVEELALVVRYLKSQVKHEKRNEGCLKFSNLVANLSRFEEDLAMARGWERSNRPVTERDRVLTASGRPTVRPPNERTPREVLVKVFDQMKEAAK